MKLHFITSVIFAVFLGMLTLADTKQSRMIYLIPVLLFFYATILLYSVEYDRQGMKLWRQKEKKLVEDTYLRFFKEKKSHK